MTELDMDRQIEYILDNFDFEAVKETMVALDWKWGSPGHIPSFNELRRTAKEQLQCAARSGYVATGGFEAELLQESVLRLSFVVESLEGIDDWEGEE